MRNNIPNRRDRADQTRDRILAAAIHHFSLYGLAGARTGAIARQANVNKALLYYYFKNKQQLYSVSLDALSGRIVESGLAALDSGSTAGESLLRCVLNHFDRILTQRDSQRLFQQEMIRVRRGESEGSRLLAGSLFGPLLEKVHDTIEAGIRSGELRKVDWLQLAYSAFGANVFYFLSAPLMRALLPFDPFSTEAIAARRKEAVQFLAGTLFCNAAHGGRLARRVLSELPMPRMEPTDLRLPRPPSTAGRLP